MTIIPLTDTFVPQDGNVTHSNGAAVKIGCNVAVKKLLCVAKSILNRSDGNRYDRVNVGFHSLGATKWKSECFWAAVRN